MYVPEIFKFEFVDVLDASDDLLEDGAGLVLGDPECCGAYLRGGVVTSCT